MASNPPGNCCTQGVRHEGKTTGELVKLDGKVDAYVTKAPQDKAHKDVGIVYLADVFGIWENSKLMADSFAAQGYTTIIPDLFYGDQLALDDMGKPGFDVMKWLAQGSDGNNPHTPEVIDSITKIGIKALRDMGVKKIGAVGYCFGAKYVVRNYKEGIDVGYTAHPSFVADDELAAITGPLSISAAQTDSIFPAELRHKSEDILIMTGLPWQINLFSDVSHGFAVRGDLSDRRQKFAKEQAFLQAVAWFDEHLV